MDVCKDLIHYEVSQCKQDIGPIVIFLGGGGGEGGVQYGKINCLESLGVGKKLYFKASTVIASFETLKKLFLFTIEIKNSLQARKIFSGTSFMMKEDIKI